jgi:hypothetical protein
VNPLWLSKGSGAIAPSLGSISLHYMDRRLGSIQSIDGQPGMFKPSASYVYGAGGFLLAASELDVLAQSEAEKQLKQSASLHTQ